MVTHIVGARRVVSHTLVRTLFEPLVTPGYAGCVVIRYTWCVHAVPLATHCVCTRRVVGARRGASHTSGCTCMWCC